MSKTTILILALGLALGFAQLGSAQLSFSEVSVDAGLDFGHGYVEGTGGIMPKMISGGVGSGDFDGDNLIDLFAVRGNLGRPRFHRNLGGGLFEEIGDTAFGGESIPSTGFENGPAFADFNGDGLLDIWIGSILAATLDNDGSGDLNEGDGSLIRPKLYLQNEDGTFTKAAGQQGPNMFNDNTYGVALADYDRDGDLDVLTSHWQVVPCQDLAPCSGHLWRNNGDGTYTDVDTASGLSAWYADRGDDKSFVPNFADINNDAWPDIVMVGDFGTSRVWINDGDGTFTDVTDTGVITDQNGMGAGIGDYDNDGNLDWFVTSIWNPDADPTPKTGNRLYLGQGDGTFLDDSEFAGVRDGQWGWGACAADLDNDGWQDIVHVNGWEGAFPTDPTRVFMNNQDGTFTDRAADFGLVSTAMGRGLSCFDYDRDGDIDVFVSNNSSHVELWRNDGGSANNWLNAMLKVPGANPFGIGGRLYATAGGLTQLREIKFGSNHESNDPAEAHFGLGSATSVDALRAVFPDQAESLFAGVAAGRWIQIEELFGDAFEDGALAAWSFERGDWTESGGGMNGVPDADIGTQIKARAIGTPVFAGCDDTCEFEGTMTASDTFGGVAEIHVRLLGFYVGKQDNVSITLKPAQDKVVLRQKVGGVSFRQDIDLALDEDQAYRAKISFDGADFHFWVDGVEVGTLANNAAGLPAGTVGFQSRNADIAISNVSATRLSDR